MPLFSPSTPQPGEPTPASPVLCIDVSNTIEAPSISGVQRITLALGPELAERVPVMFLDGRSGRLRPIRWPARQRLRRLERGESGRTVAGRLESRAIRNAPQPKQPFHFGPDTVLIDIEPSWHAPQSRADLLPRLSRTPTAAIIHDVLPITNPDWFPPRSIERFRSWFSAHVDAGSVLMAISDSTANAVVDAAPHVRRPAVIHLGGAPSLPPSSGRGVLMVGTIEPRKGHALILDALDLLGDRAPVIDVVGRPGWAADQLTTRLRAHPRIRWHEGASDAELAELWSLTGLLLQPSLGEGYGLPVVEALQRRVAVVASDIPVMLEVGRGQIDHLPLEPARWAEALATYTDDPAAWHRPDPLVWPAWRDTADDVMGALVAGGAWPEARLTSR